MTDTEQKHTPLVSSGELRCWRDDGTWFIGDGSCFVAEADNHDNATYIVEACNAYPDLKAKVEEQAAEIKRLEKQIKAEQKATDNALDNYDAERRKTDAMKEREAKVKERTILVLKSIVEDCDDNIPDNARRTAAYNINQMEADNE